MGYSQHIQSDNGHNFVGANRKLKSSLKRLNQSLLSVKLNLFIPLCRPWLGGAWKSLVKVLKKVLKSEISNQSIRKDQLTTILIEIERVVNSWPRVSISDDILNLTYKEETIS